jgi:UTP--glucose-1-phosphate uridylyltransferase
MLPATKVVPKELLPVVDKPLIQFIVEEIVESGIEEVIVRQSYPMGLGHAVLCARSLINNEPFAVLLFCPTILSSRRGPASGSSSTSSMNTGTP